MRIISISKLKQDANNYPDLKQIIDSWCLVVKGVDSNHLEDVKNVYPSTEAVGNFTVFNFKGNKYRLIVGIDYIKQIVYYKYLLTHTNLQNDCYKCRLGCPRQRCDSLRGDEGAIAMGRSRSVPKA